MAEGNVKEYLNFLEVLHVFQTDQVLALYLESPLSGAVD